MNFEDEALAAQTNAEIAIYASPALFRAHSILVMTGVSERTADMMDAGDIKGIAIDVLIPQQETPVQAKEQIKITDKYGVQNTYLIRSSQDVAGGHYARCEKLK